MLANLLEIEKGDVVSIVGSGGKTTLLYSLADELKKNEVIVSTTTKMFIPAEKFNFIYNPSESVLNGINVLIEKKIENKFSTSIEWIDVFRKKCDYTIIECDGAKMKPLKGWNKFEPVIPKFTSKTIGVIPVDILYKPIEEKRIHRIDEFLEVSKSKVEDSITEETIKNIILAKNGLFKNSIGLKILFLNKVDNCKEEYLEKIIENLPFEILDIVIVGSLKEKKFRRIHKR